MENKITAEGIIHEALHCKGKMYGSDYPVQVFPHQIQDIIYATGECLNYPIDYIAASLCFVLSVGIGNTHVAKLKEGWSERAILYIALIGRPGVNKSHPLSFAFHPLFEHDAKNAVTFKKEIKEYEQLLYLSRKEREEQGISELPNEPVLKKFVVSDITPESLAFIHENNKRGICLYTDELASWFKNFNRYTKGSEEQFWLSLYNGKPIILDRRGSKNSVSVKNSFIGVIGTIQHGVLREMAKGERNQNGFLDRILFVLPNNLEKQYWSEQHLSRHVIPTWNNLMQKLINQEYLTDDNGDIIPVELYFQEDARKRLYDWQRENTDQCNREINETLMGIYSKLEIYAIRFCLILQVARWLCGEASKDSIDLVSVEGAIELVGYYQKTARKVQQIIASSTTLEQLPSDKQRLYNALPSDFSTAEGIQVASLFSISADSFKRMLSDFKDGLLDNYKHGRYRKLL
ncbi:hypothetical protein M2459_002133 [Parabacteroides sp. PF5-5]|uniref:DUF3987 domain-containing protein n=1 Tax=unclassified Parabacteroides TaxID=2649774 RepID=UPI0024746B49|nr:MULTISPECIES: DUF3987 domain-containing protein [unclassified Parabacteroides]MDH6306850.1 hypothetical protein [Parabacteroides sp. PH5-39]MDH6316296.1 hypothetical protein [Parabacteroides sp. PF5-13]MDH6319779.1 hypothetical protein [Parabacteroides sp. PH5-13]MDH6323630.1 hypothetical protein [Parabacteroides sp. PH5-8]MDH6327483.1 hypothetical protein [Parabacteroides sp. PH5-41]